MSGPVAAQADKPIGVAATETAVYTTGTRIVRPRNDNVSVVAIHVAELDGTPKQDFTWPQNPAPVTAEAMATAVAYSAPSNGDVRVYVAGTRPIYGNNGVQAFLLCVAKGDGDDLEVQWSQTLEPPNPGLPSYVEEVPITIAIDGDGPYANLAVVTRRYEQGVGYRWVTYAYTVSGMEIFTPKVWAPGGDSTDLPVGIGMQGGYVMVAGKAPVQNLGGLRGIAVLAYEYVPPTGSGRQPGSLAANAPAYLSTATTHELIPKAATNCANAQTRAFFTSAFAVASERRPVSSGNSDFHTSVFDVVATSGTQLFNISFEEDDVYDFGGHDVPTAIAVHAWQTPPDTTSEPRIAVSGTTTALGSGDIATVQYHLNGTPVLSPAWYSIWGGSGVDAPTALEFVEWSNGSAIERRVFVAGQLSNGSNADYVLLKFDAMTTGGGSQNPEYGVFAGPAGDDIAINLWTVFLPDAPTSPDDRWTTFLAGHSWHSTNAQDFVTARYRVGQ